MRKSHDNRGFEMSPILRQTKIVVTLGPALDDPQVLKQVMLAGADIFRANFSHADHSAHEKRIQCIREIAADQKKTVATHADLQGPKIRIGRFKEGKIQLQEGQAFTLDIELEEAYGDEKSVSVNYKHLPHDVHLGDTLLLDDGRIVLV